MRNFSWDSFFVALVFIVFFACLFGTMAYYNYGVTKAKIECIKAGMTYDNRNGSCIKEDLKP